jgi:hypothetical protein
MEIILNLDEEQARLIAAEGEPQAYVEGLVAAECRRLWHIERSKPKPKVAKPPGPRRLTPVEKEIRERGDFLRNIYLKLHEMLGAEFPDELRRQENEIEIAIEALDLETLIRYIQEQPWQRRQG